MQTRANDKHLDAVVVQAHAEGRTLVERVLRLVRGIQINHVLRPGERARSPMHDKSRAFVRAESTKSPPHTFDSR
jgi:hypothetical protein